MIATVSSRDFQRELELLSKVVAQKPTIPALANCLVQAEGEGLRLAATDLEIGLITFCPAQVSQPGTTTLPVKHLLDIVKLLPDRDLMFSLDKAQMQLTSGNYTTKLQTHPVRDYPDMPSMQGLTTTPLPGAMLEMINKTRFAIPESGKGKKYYMDGAMLTSVSLAATDGHRLAYTTCEEIGPLDPLIIPRKALDKLAEMLTADGVVAVGERHLFFVTDGRLLFSRLVDEKFPQYERIIPRDTDYTLVVAREEFKALLERVILTGAEVVFTLTQNLLTAVSRGAATGEALEFLTVQYAGPDLKLVMHGTYLLDFLRAATNSHVTLAWKDRSPVLCTDGDHYVYCQMPLRSV